jgi:serine/threonine protein kinase
MNTEPEREFVGNGRYALDQSLGKGGAGEVVLAYDLSLTRWVAIKRIPATDADIAREAGVLANFQHPNIVAVYDVFEEGGQVLIVMEFLQGQTLEELTEPMDEEMFRHVAAQCLEGLGAAHAKHIVHRHIKPGNIMLVPLPEGGCQVKLLDFGQSRVMEAPSLQTMDHSGAVVGSVDMMSPEQLKHEELDSRSDLYSLGCVFYQALTRQRPFTGKNPAQVLSAHLNRKFQPLASIRPDLPQSLTAWVERLFSLDRNDRPASAQEALQTLRATPAAPLATAKAAVAVAAPVPIAVAKPVAVAAAKAVKPAPVATAAKPAFTNPHRTVSTPSPQPPPEPSRKFPVPLWIPLAAAAVLLIAGGAFLVFRAMSPQEGLLFGADLSNADFPPGTWTISNGIMKGNGKSGAIWTKKEYENFDLHFEVRVARRANSGIFLRSPNPEELKQKRINFQQATMELEIIEGKGAPGSILTVCKPPKPIALEAGKWHTLDIKAVGPMITVSFDGNKLYDIDLSKGTKPGQNPDGSWNIFNVALKDLPKKGRIGIQDWLGPVEFRNFRIKEL